MSDVHEKWAGVGDLVVVRIGYQNLLVPFGVARAIAEAAMFQQVREVSQDYIAGEYRYTTGEPLDVEFKGRGLTSTDQLERLKQDDELQKLRKRVEDDELQKLRKRVEELEWTDAASRQPESPTSPDFP